MGSCISKCRSKKKFKEEDIPHVHDKLVISQGPPISSAPTKMTPIPLHKPPSPPPSTSSTSSFSSFSRSKCSTMASSVSSSSSLSSSSCSSSVFSVKDRSFSNEFLLSCVKDNPHAIGLKENKIHSYSLDSSLLLSSPKLKHSVQEKATITPKKRARASSPTLVRQKSFRKEQNSVTLTPSRGLRSPSPSRRFNGENNRSFSTNGTYENSYKRPVLSKGKSAVSSATSGPRRESFRASIASPNRDLSINPDFLVRKKDAFAQQISTKIDAQHGVGDIVMEDINNPLIDLDCFIFL
ncbi:hypothetical protein ACS0TY_027619 [Phlomoides rotata]